MVRDEDFGQAAVIEATYRGVKPQAERLDVEAGTPPPIRW
jgi:hypothetical protein